MTPLWGGWRLSASLTSSSKRSSGTTMVVGVAVRTVARHHAGAPALAVAPRHALMAVAVVVVAVVAAGAPIRVPAPHHAGAHHLAGAPTRGGADLARGAEYSREVALHVS